MAFSAEQSKLKPPGAIAGPGALPPPETPPPLPAPVPPPRRRAAGRGLALLAMGLLVLLGGAAIVWSSRSAAADSGRSAARSGGSQDGGRQNDGAQAGLGGRDVGFLGKAGTFIRGLRGSHEQEAAAGGGSEGVAADSGGVTAGSGGSQETDASVSGSVVARGESRDGGTQVGGQADVEPARPVVWPAVNLSAIVGAGSRGSALLNGEPLAVGQQTTDGISLVSVEARAALLEYQGERKRFLVGGSGATP